MEKRLLAFIVSKDANTLHLHVDKEGVDILIRELERIRKGLDANDCPHTHLFSDDWGGWELSLSDEMEGEKGSSIHHLKIYGWNEEWAEKHGFDRSFATS